jgi:SAM-dependent methyltransferase
MRAAVLARGARQLGHPHGWFGRWVMPRLLNRGNRPTVTGAVKALDARAGDTVADIGFGGGLGLRLLLDAVGPTGHVHGVDVSASALANARRAFRADAGRLALQEGSITALPLPDNGIDGAICVNIVYFVEDVRAAFTEVARVLRPGGRLVLGVADPALLRALPFAPYGFIVRELDELRAALTESGFAEPHDHRLGEFHLLVAEAGVA